MFASKLIRTSKGFPTKVITLQKMLEILEIPEKGKLMHAYLWVFTFPRKGFHTLGFHTLGATPSSPFGSFISGSPGSDQILAVAAHCFSHLIAFA